MRSDRLFLRVEPWMRRLGLRDHGRALLPAAGTAAPPDIFLLGFCWTASSLLAEIARRNPTLLPRLVVIDFNPEVHRRLSERGVRAVWGDVSQWDTLEHAGLGRAKLVLCTLPNTVLRGINNLRLVQLVRSLNPEACVVAQAELLTDVPKLRAAGATHVQVSRLLEADEFLDVIEASDKHLLDEKIGRIAERLKARDEVIP